ncbi:hypothetical protein ACFSOV_23325 [Pedobacter petrophilus]|uniref:hypothetical protein n=1 Tax=Pedobacter petrophilus TaxID=1908241 RepID=UPI00363AA1B1
MKKILLTLTVLFALLSTVQAQFEGSKQIFESPKLKEAVKLQKLVAILPFEVKISIANSLRTSMQMLTKHKNCQWRNRYRPACTLSC